jgi:hypothetical protein
MNESGDDYNRPVLPPSGWEMEIDSNVGGRERDKSPQTEMCWGVGSVVGILCLSSPCVRPVWISKCRHQEINISMDNLRPENCKNRQFMSMFPIRLELRRDCPF